MIQDSPTRRVLRKEGRPVLELSVQQPHAEHPRIKRYYSALAERWTAYWEEELLPAAWQALREKPNDAPWKAELRSVAAWDGAKLLSIRTDALQTDSRNCTLRVCSSCTWEKKSGTPLPLSRFLPGLILHRKQLFVQLQAEGERLLAQGNTLLDPDFAAKLRRYFRPERFYLSEGRLHIHYPLCSVAPCAEGIPVFTLPLPDGIE